MLDRGTVVLGNQRLAQPQGPSADLGVFFE